ncbi:MAG: retropepsin-like aspartic protease [Rectinemataceae bacterium]
MSLNYSAVTLHSRGRLRDIITEVDVGLSESLAIVFGQPFSVTHIKALWDTGASTTSVSTEFANRVGLQAIDFTKIHGAGGVHDSRIFKIDLIIPGTQVRINDIEATEFVGNGFDMLIGMDIITLGDFSITNAGQQTMFSFRIPSDAFHIDYVAMIGSNREAKAAIERYKRKQHRH